jgi:hypothetical protein
MLHPVGDLSPSVYWRRRILLLAAFALAVVSLYAVVFHHNGDNKTKAASSLPPTQTTNPTTGSTTTTGQSSASTSATSPSQSSATPPVPKACLAGQLVIAAATDKPTYAVGDRPKVALVVTNTGTAPCVTDLADQQIELRVFSGSARVWGSHDCAVEPGTSKETLPVGQQIRREIEWSGLSSQPGCAGVRQRVSAGNYTLFALLDGRQGTPAHFAFTG